MKVFTDDHDWFVAADLDDLRSVVDEHHGNADVFPTGEWTEEDADKPLTIWCNADGRPDEPNGDGNAKVTRTMAEWAELNGRGMLCSTER